jgi:hypothetical protein
MDSVDSASIPVIAQLCPLQYGAVVYKARALYTSVWNNLRVWCEACDEGQGEQQGQGQRPSIKATVHNNESQLYSLYPNPNDGNITLVQRVTDSAVVVVDVTDMLGRSVHKEDALFVANKHSLDLNKLAPGMYVASIIESNGRKFIFRFVKQ